MKPVIVTLLLIAIFPPYVSLANELTAAERLDLLPLPPNVKVERNADLSVDDALKFSQMHKDFAFLDPFLTERRKNEIPEHVSLRFTTDAPSRDIYLFYKRFFNEEAEKNSSERTLPYYNSRSYSSFDAINEADVTRDSKVGNATYYKIDARGKGRRAFIVIFNDGEGPTTTTFLITLNEES